MSQVHKVHKVLEPQVTKSEEEKGTEEALNPSHDEATDAEEFADSMPISFV